MDVCTYTYFNEGTPSFEFLEFASEALKKLKTKSQELNFAAAAAAAAAANTIHIVKCSPQLTESTRCSCYSPRLSARAARQPIPSHCFHFAYKRVSRTCRTSLFLGDSQVTSVFRTALVQPSERKSSTKKLTARLCVRACVCVFVCLCVERIAAPAASG